jgi:putative salt-induced outer membrane protein YdiY
LQQEVIRWYQYPRRWTKGWDSHAEFGIDGSDGNADTLAIQTGLETRRKTDAYSFALDLDYRQASSRSVTTEDNGRLNLDYDRMLNGSPWSMFSKLGLEWDAFKAFDLRLNLNGGLGYHWIRNDTTTLVTRLGAGTSREFGSPVEEWIPEGVFAMEAERQLSERQKVRGRIDYFPSLEDFTDFRLVSDASWEILLDGSENFSLKLSASDRYDSTPQGVLANDLYYSLLPFDLVSNERLH